MLKRFYIALILMFTLGVISCEKEIIKPYDGEAPAYNGCYNYDTEGETEVRGQLDNGKLGGGDEGGSITDPDEDEDYDLDSNPITDPDEDEDYDTDNDDESGK